MHCLESNIVSGVEYKLGNVINKEFKQVNRTKELTLETVAMMHIRIEFSLALK